MNDLNSINIKVKFKNKILTILNKILLYIIIFGSIFEGTFKPFVLFVLVYKKMPKTINYF